MSPEINRGPIRTTLDDNLQQLNEDHPQIAGNLAARLYEFGASFLKPGMTIYTTIRSAVVVRALEKNIPPEEIVNNAFSGNELTAHKILRRLGMVEDE